jgi:hypothetical protein
MTQACVTGVGVEIDAVRKISFKSGTDIDAAWQNHQTWD